MYFFFFSPLANTEVKENKESEKKADPFKEPPLESEALSRVRYFLDSCCINRQAPVVTSIKFLLTASGYNQGKKS